MKFYVAAKWQLKEEVREIYRKIKEASHEITEDWTRHPPAKPYDKNKDLSRKLSVIDMNAVKNSDVFVLLTNEDGVGMYIEIGGAIMSRIINGKPRVYVIGKKLGRSMFFFHPVVKRRKTIEDVFEDLGI
jgi:hypothetical protein